MIEVSHRVMEAIAESKEKKAARLIDQALDEIRHINGLKQNPHFQWFLGLALSEVRELEEKILAPRLVRDEDMPVERLKLVEWRKFLTLLERKETEARNILERDLKNT
ncbi:MAG: hypothetical protein V1746_06445 [bacterium]